MKTLLPDRQKNIVQWVSQATGINTLGVKIRLRGNDLHILCESVECPQRWHTLTDLLKALQQTDLDALTSNDNHEQPSIYQVFVYGRKKSNPKPEWCHRVYLNQLDRHLEQVNQALIRDSQSKQTAGALIVSNESLARQGDPEALARYLSETLSALGISVQVKVKKQKPSAGQLTGDSRLWILCRASYSPDPSIFADVVAQKLRFLKLSGYQDAVIATQVQGETKPDWMLRIDLTPPEVMLKEWARWGDVQAIALYLNDKLIELLSDTKIKVTASLKESTIHIFCSAITIPDRQMCMETIGSILENIAPQAITAATIYGQTNIAEQPAWIDWLVLPAQNHPPLAISPLELASSADEPAIIFLLERLLNPDLNLRLQTGGIRVLLLRKGDLMHVMCDAPVCPTRKQVAPHVIQLLRQLQIPGIKGGRVYGRRAGNKEPLWHHGADFQVRQRVVPEPPPEFAVTDAYVRELLPGDSNESLLRPDLTVEEVQSFVTRIAQDWGATAKKFLLGSQLFMEIGQPTERTDEGRGRLVALVWGTLGLLLAFQTDWILNRFVSQADTPTATVIGSATNASAESKSATTFTSNNPSKIDGTFNASAFTQTDGKKVTGGKATATAILLAARGQMPTFNARQLDEQLALYKQRLQKTGKPPDVLVIGSSRALRGVDPVALSKALAIQGYRNLDVFNFGINGATVQVVDFILRKVLQPSELPKMVIWADGARAFNSGREDLTFGAIAVSPGYKQALEKYIAQGNVDEVAKPKDEIKKDNSQQETSYQVANKWLNQNLAGLSGTYQHRDQLKSLINQKLKTLPMMEEAIPSKAKTNSTDIEQDVEAQSVDFDGFLALSTRFDPTTYYQKHPKVSGDYDNDYKSFQLAGEQDAALQAILKFAQLQKISLVFVNMPLTSEYLDPIRVKHEQEFQQYMLQVAAERPNFIFRDFTLLYPEKNAFFSDPSHLNRYGAYEVSNKLAKDAMIPWSSKKVSNSGS
jgi:hypothetical protein